MAIKSTPAPKPAPVVTPAKVVAPVASKPTVGGGSTTTGGTPSILGGSTVTGSKPSVLSSTVTPSKVAVTTSAPAKTATVAPTVIKTGSTGSSVSGLQTQLNSLGYKAGAVDGINGSNTSAAIKAFQSANGLVADGIVGAKTLAALSSGSAKAFSAPSGNSSGSLGGSTVTKSPYASLPSGGSTVGNSSGISSAFSSAGGSFPLSVQDRLAIPAFKAAHDKSGFQAGEYKGTRTQNMRVLGNLNQDELNAYYAKSGATPTTVPTNPEAVIPPVTPDPTAFDPTAIGKVNDSYTNSLNQYLPQIESPQEMQKRLYDQFMEKMNARDGIRKQIIDEVNRKGRIRLGQTIANQANAGALGSTVGAAQQGEAEILNNQDLQNETNNANASMIDLQAQYADQSQNGVLKNLNAIQQAYSMRGDRETANAASIFSVLANKGTDITKLGLPEMTQLAQQTGIPVQSIMKAYSDFIHTSKAEQLAQNKANPGFKLDQGQSQYEYNPKTGQYENVASVAPKDPTATAESAKVHAASLQQAQSQILKSTEIKNLVDDIKIGLSQGNGHTGTFAGVLNAVPGTQGYEFKKKLERLKALLSTDAIKLFKGTGAMSDREFGAASASASILTPNLTNDSFLKELDRIYTNMNNSETEANGILQGGATYGAPQAPATSTGGSISWESIMD